MESAMIIGYLDVKCITVAPLETQSPLLIDADAILPFAVSLQRLHAIRGRQHHEFQVCRCVQLRKPQTRSCANLRRKAPLRFAFKEFSRVAVGERLYHDAIISRSDNRRKKMEWQLVVCGVRPKRSNLLTTKNAKDAKERPGREVV